MRALVTVGAAAAVPLSFDGGGCHCRLVVVLGCSSWPWTVVAVAGFSVMGGHWRSSMLVVRRKEAMSHIMAMASHLNFHMRSHVNDLT